MNGGNYSTPRSNNKRKAGMADSGVRVKNMDLLEPKDIYPPEGESAVPEDPVISADLRSTLVERLKSIEENLTQLNKQEPPSPFEGSSPGPGPGPGPKNVEKKNKAAAMPSFMEQAPSSSSSSSKAKKERFHVPNVGMPLPPRGRGVEEKARVLRATMAATRADIERAKKLASFSPSKKAHHLRLVAEAVNVSAASEDGAAFKEQLSEVDISSLSSLGRDEGQGVEENGERNKNNASVGAGEQKTKNKAKVPDPDPLSGIPLQDRPAHTLSHLEFRNRVIAARVAATGTLLRCKDKARVQQSFIDQQLQHYRSVNKDRSKGEEEKEKEKGAKPKQAKIVAAVVAAVAAEAALVACPDSVPLLPLGEQHKAPHQEGAAPALPLTEMSLLKLKVSVWKHKYGEFSIRGPTDNKEEEEEVPGPHTAGTPLKAEAEGEGEGEGRQSPYHQDLPPPAPPLSDDEISI